MWTGLRVLGATWVWFRLYVCSSLPQDILLSLEYFKEHPEKELDAVHSLRSVSSKTEPFSIEWTTHLSADRFPRLVALLEAWQGRLSVAIYFPFSEDIETLQAEIPKAFDQLNNSRLHFVLVKPSFSEASTRQRLRYPINRLRNEALRRATAQYVIPCDIDFLPSPRLAAALKDELPAFLRRRPHTAVVIPSVQISRNAMKTFSNSAQSRLISGGWRSLHLEGTPYQNAGHGPTMPLLATRRRLSWFDVIYEPQYEPYVAIVRCRFPPYDERFADQGGDKQSHVASLNEAAWSFIGISGVHLVHSNEDPSIDLWPVDRMTTSSERRRSHFSSAQADTQRFRFFEDFVPEMASKGGLTFRFPKGASSVALSSGRMYGRAGPSVAFGL